MTDKTLSCRDCNNEFIFTVGEQEFYKEKGFENEPVRCPDCRRAKKAQNNRRQLFQEQKATSALFIGALQCVSNGTFETKKPPAMQVEEIIASASRK